MSIMLLAMYIMMTCNYLDAVDMYNYCMDEGWSMCTLEYDGLVTGWSVYYK